MKNTAIIIIGILITFNTFAQSPFQVKALEVERYIMAQVQVERNLLKEQIADINDRDDAGYLREGEADDMKAKAARKSARNIEILIEDAQVDLTDIIKTRINEALGTELDLANNQDNDKDDDEDDDIYESYDDDHDDGRRHRDFGINMDKNKFFGIKTNNSNFWNNESRHTSQFVMAFGFNNLIDNGDLNTYDGSEIEIGSSNYFEWGMTGKTRMIEESNLLHFKYGLSFLYRKIAPLNNQYYVKDGNMTFLETHEQQLKKAKLRTVSIIAPIHIEFDLTRKRYSSDGSRIRYNTQNSFRFGIGGYAGFNIKTKQTLEYNLDTEFIKQKIKDNFNTNTYVYGISGYVGFRDISLFGRYDMSNYFRNNDVDQNLLTLGVRFDWN